MQPVEIPSNESWGKRYGTFSDIKPKNCNLPWGNHFPKTGYGSSASNSNKSVNVAQSVQSKEDKAKYEIMKNTIGRPVIRVGLGNKRINAKAH